MDVAVGGQLSDAPSGWSRCTSEHIDVDIRSIHYCLASSATLIMSDAHATTAVMWRAEPAMIESTRSSDFMS